MGIAPLGTDPVALLGLGTAGASALTTAAAASPAVADELVGLSLGSELFSTASAPTGLGTYLPPLPAGPFWSSGAQLGAATAAAGTAAAGAVPADAVALGSLTAGGQELAALFGAGTLPTSGALYDVLV